MAKLTTALLSVLAMAPYSYAGNLIVKNQCPTTIWCGAAKNDGTFSPSVQVAPGASYTSPKPAYNDGIGAVLKCGQEQDMLHPYQLEMAVQNGRSWLDLSNLDGSPYHGFHRHAEIAGDLN
ncbi:hypothetical protein NUW58_g3687 [Xylaria curta]|uniref:Uncharacterized protein n=1 Tax=Xylaria curta TaxID=42375 RepID=A0ACC1PBC5_9PEZI|nr:hypothetical protein NUW58_g3687 [Xylaria curta]